MKTNTPSRIVLHLLVVTALFSGARGPAASPSVPRFAPHEVALTATGSYANPYTECAAECVLTAPDGKAARTLPLFWDGGATWKFRFAPDQPGAWKWTVRSADAGMNGKSGAFACVASERKGSLQPMAGAPHHFQYQNGARVWFLGDTAWALVTDDAEEQHHRASVERYLKARAAQGFNVVHLMALNEAGWGNSGGPPWRDLAKQEINPAYWQEADARVAFANAQGLVCGIALAWGEKTGKEKYPWGRFPNLEARKRYARAIAARYSAYDVYFLVSGEWHGEVKNRRQPEDVVRREFIALGDTLQAADPHGRMIGIHPMTRAGSVREYHEAAWMSFGDYQQNYLHLHERVLESRSFNKPLVNSEYAYFLRDADGDGKVDKHHSYTVADIRHATWDIAMAGGYLVSGFGSTYMGGHRHPTPFLPDDPQNVPWEKEIGVVKGCFTALEYWKLEPHDELLECATPRGQSRNRKVDINDKQRTMNQTDAVAWWCLAEPGRQYLLYARGVKEPVTLKLVGGAALKATQFDPRTGEQKALGSIDGRDRLEFRPPDEHDWLVMVR